MSIEIMTDVWKKSRQSGAKLLLLLAIADSANEANGCTAWPSVATLAKKIRASPKHTQDLIHELCKESDPELEIVKVGGGRSANVYRVVSKNLGKVSPLPCSTPPLQHPSPPLYSTPHPSPVAPPNHNRSDNLNISLGAKKSDPACDEKSLSSPVETIQEEQPMQDESSQMNTGKPSSTQSDGKKRDILAAMAASQPYWDYTGMNILHVEDYSESVRPVVAKFCQLWKITPPRRKGKKGGDFILWEQSAEELRQICAEIGLPVIDKIHADWDRQMVENGGIPRWVPTSPQSLIKTARGTVGLMRVTPQKEIKRESDGGFYA